MSQSVRKLIGTVATVLVVIVYSLFAMALAVRLLPNQDHAAQVAYYALAGLLWVVPVGLIIRWMEH